MKMMLAGMLAMVDMTAWFLAQADDTTPWDKHVLFGLIGGTGGFVIHAALFGVDVDLEIGQRSTSRYIQEICRRALAAISIAVLFGPVSATIMSVWLKINAQALLVPVCALASMIGPYAVAQWGKRALDAGAEMGLRILEGDRNGPCKPCDSDKKE